MMNDSRQPGQPAPRDGLCPGCANVQVVSNARGSSFYLCRLSRTDEQFPKYPVQPVIACGGYRPAD